MCTMVMKRILESGILVAAKTVDTPKTILTFDLKQRGPSGYTFLYFKMGWQKGINSGMNQEGLAVLSAYAGTKLPNHLGEDTRGMANESVLNECSTVQSGIEKLKTFFKKQPSGVGGTHFLMDQTGAMAVFEHEPNVMFQHQIVQSDEVIRANEPFLLHEKDEEQEALDRRLRYTQAEFGLKKVTSENWLASLKQLLSSHLPEEKHQLGQVCIHDFENNGARSKDLKTHTTETALIFNVRHRQLFYSVGPPCKDQWRVLTLNE